MYLTGIDKQATLTVHVLQVSGLELAVANGSLVWLTKATHPHLFRAAQVLVFASESRCLQAFLHFPIPR